MIDPRDDLKPTVSVSNTELDLYFSESAKGTIYRRMIAMQEWRNLHPKQRQRLQQESQRFSAGDIALSESYTQSVLLLQRIKRLVQVGRVAA